MVLQLNEFKIFGGILIMNKSRLSLVDLPYNNQNKAEPVYTSAFSKPKKERDGFISKVRGTIYGAVRKVRGK